MWDVLLNWNQEYYQWSWADLGRRSAGLTRTSRRSACSTSWRPGGRRRRHSPRPDRAILAALYLGWLVQATVIQKTFDYAHYPPTLLGLAVLASLRWPVGPVFLGWCVAAGLVNEFAGDSLWFREPATGGTPALGRSCFAAPPNRARRDRLALWGRCWTDDSWELKDQLTFYHDIHCAPDWADLQRVADFLATKDLQDRELICWHDSTHPLYVWLNIRPAIRYPHVITAMKFRSKRDQIRQRDVREPGPVRGQRLGAGHVPESDRTGPAARPGNRAAAGLPGLGQGRLSLEPAGRVPGGAVRRPRSPRPAGGDRFLPECSEGSSPLAE